MIKIIGLDVGSASVVSCCLSELPKSLRQYLNAHKRDIEEYSATRKGIQDLLALNPDCVALEPTGIHYSEFWYKALIASGVEVRWVGHVQVRAYRKLNRLPDKNDKADALALASYCLAHYDEPEYFLRFVAEPAQRLRRLCLQLDHLNRLENPIVNCARQYLAHEFPEAANRRSLRKKRDDLPALWGWLAQERPSLYFDRLWRRSVAQDFGLEISAFTRAQARRICDLERHQGEIEQEIDTLLAGAEFAPYQAVLDKFGFGLRTRAVLLAHLYPFADFLGADRKPLIEWGESAAGKPTKIDRSERAFKLRLGMGLVEDSSGKSTAWVPGGSAACRMSLWQWVLTRIEPKQRRLPTAVGQQLGAYLDGLKAGGTPSKVVQMRTAAKAVALLYKALIQSFTGSQT